jgi:hypothetical protein
MVATTRPADLGAPPVRMLLYAGHDNTLYPLSAALAVSPATSGAPPDPCDAVGFECVTRDSDARIFVRAIVVSSSGQLPGPEITGVPGPGSAAAEIDTGGIIANVTTAKADTPGVRAGTPGAPAFAATAVRMPWCPPAVPEDPTLCAWGDFVQRVVAVQRVGLVSMGDAEGSEAGVRAGVAKVAALDDPQPRRDLH